MKPPTLAELVHDVNATDAELLTMRRGAVGGRRWHRLAARRADLSAQIRGVSGRRTPEGNLNALILGIKPGGVSSRSGN